MSTLFIANIIALLFSFFVVGALLGVAFSKPLREKIIAFIRARRDVLLARMLVNPILRPGKTPWTAEAVLNPAALSLGGRVHLLYRAIGRDGVSRLGYASSPNGLVFDEILSYPVYAAQKPFTTRGPRRYSPVRYPSGGSWGGCEDPRAVVIDGQVHVTYNAFDGWDFIRVALISLSEEDFLKKRFTWTAPKFLSKSGERHKNWTLFPEKINGKVAILHNLHTGDPRSVCVEYIDDLATFDPDKKPIKSPDPQATPSKKIAWHERMRSAGPPPLKTDVGWLVFYHAMSPGEGHRYKLGAMILDLADPRRVLHRAHVPVLSPDAPYENDGKPGIVYACGALIRGDMLYVYYGGADKVVCVATAPLAPFLKALMEGATTTALSPASLQTA